MATIAMNYSIATVACYLAIILVGDWDASSFTLAFGVLMGLTFMMGMIILTISYNQKGVALTGTIFQLAILIPTFMSLFIWGETTSAVQTVGIILALASLPLLSRKETGSTSIDRAVLLTTVANFVINGVNMSAGKILVEAGYADQQLMFFFVVYLTASLGAVLLVIKKGTKPSVVDLGYGSLVGGLNALLNLTMVAALTLMPGSLFFPFSSSFGLLATVILSIALLQERIRKINAIGIVTSLAAVILINL